MKTLFLVAILAAVWFLIIIGVLGGKISYYRHYRRERQQVSLPTAGNAEPAGGNSSTDLSAAVSPGAAGAGVGKVAGNISPGNFGVQPRSSNDTSGLSRNPRTPEQYRPVKKTG
ncbi:hypothetical protein [Moorella sp. Hama-1]|uniref:hypothetical protein n=1 Tax=Moorella sp. Hama-1 TaxID=2138101 RepID=UPI000D6442A7|nr:hypothetical protein [Moorella sp. Hama-1]BCV20228.1 hypothetical protein hamaS1_02970 [Moorella sp. Hama-1]